MPGASANPTADAASAFAHCAILLFDGGTVVAQGAISERVLGEAAAQLVGVPKERLPGELQSLIETVISSQTEQLLPQLELPSGKAGTRLLRVMGAPMKSNPGSAILILSELDEPKAFDSSLRHLERLAGMGTLAASLAHEIRNSLVAVKAFVDLLIESGKDAETARMVQRELRRSDGLLAQMLRFTGSTSQSFVPLHVHTVLEHCLRLLRPQLELQAIVLERAFAAEPDLVKGNEDELQQVIVNLLLNALDAMGSQGTLTLRTEIMRNGAEEKLQLSVKDSGAGIPSGVESRVFDPFFTTKESGTGLGLAITRRILEEHQGAITVRSRPGEGAEFLVTLPLVREA